MAASSASTCTPDTAYRGIDGSASPFADDIVDLTGYTSMVPGIVLRGVLEHNVEWRAVLDNAIASFTDQLIIVLFTPLVERTVTLCIEPDYGNVPVIAFALDELVERFDESEHVVHWTVPSLDTAFGTETFVVAVR